jgi:hypothetical protein
VNGGRDRVVLDGVPEVHFYRGGARCPEDIIVPSVVRAVLEYLGDADYGCKHCAALNPGCKVPCTYAFLVGVSGAASFLSWHEGWEGDNVEIHYMSADDAAPEQRIFRAIGYEYEWVAREPGRDSEALFRERIAESLARGIPVVGYGVIGPPEASIIAGYDEGGDVLLGWSFFQHSPEFNAGVEFEPADNGQGTGYFRKRGWFKDTDCLLVIGDKVDKPPLGETYREALRWMLEVTRTSMVRPEPDAPAWYRQRHNGLAAYEAWAEHLLRDEAWPADDEATLADHHRIHNDAVGQVAEARWYGAQFLIQASDPDILPYSMAEDVLHAAACYAGEHDLMWKLWDLAGGNGNPEAYRYLADPAIRHQMATIIRQARDKDAQAADYLEHALRVAERASQ